MMRAVKAQYIVDQDGKKSAVVLDMKTYQVFLRALEEIEDREAFDAVEREQAIPYAQIEARLRRRGRV